MWHVHATRKFPRAFLPCPTHPITLCHLAFLLPKCLSRRVLCLWTTPLNCAHLFDPSNYNPLLQATHPPWPEILSKRSLYYRPNAPHLARSDLRTLLFQSNHSPRNSDVVRANLSLIGSIENLEGRGERAAHLMSHTVESPTVTVAHLQGTSDDLAFLMVSES